MKLNVKKNRHAPGLFLLALLAAPSAAGGQTQPATQTQPAAAADPAAACACEASPLPEVLATVNGVNVTRQDISPAAQKRVADLQQQVVEARRRELDLQINSALLEAEAKKRGVTATKLLEAEVIARAQEPTEAEAQKFYDENKARIGREFKDVKEGILSYLRDVRRGEQAAKFSNSLRATAQLKRLAAEATPPANDAERARVLATVNG